MTKNTATVVAIPTLADYQSADKDGKAAIRKAVRATMLDAVKNGDLPTAQAAQAALDGYSPAKPERAEVDYQQVLATRISVLRQAAFALEQGHVVPDGFPEGFTFDKETVADETATDIVAEGAKVALTKVTRSGNRSDIEAAIEAAFDGMPSGTFLTCSEIANKQGLPSQGAVAARWPNWNEAHSDIVAGRKDGSETGTKGYTKA